MIHPELSAIFCDDIRHERSGKDVYVGVYGDEVILPSLPHAVPNFFIAWTLRLPPNLLPERILLEVYKGRERIMKLDGRIETSEGPPPADFLPTLRGVINIPREKLHFEEATTIRLEGKIDDHTFTHGPAIFVRTNSSE